MLAETTTAPSGLDLATVGSIGELAHGELSECLLVARGWLLVPLEGYSTSVLPGVVDSVVLEPVRLVCPEGAPALAQNTAGVSR